MKKASKLAPEEPIGTKDTFKAIDIVELLLNEKRIDFKFGREMHRRIGPNNTIIEEGFCTIYTVDDEDCCNGGGELIPFRATIEFGEPRPPEVSE